MSLDDLEQAVKSVLRAVEKNQDTLVYCNQGRYDSGNFLIFVIALIEGGSSVQDVMDHYTDDSACQPHDCAQIWHDCGLSKVLQYARLDLEIQKRIAAITPKMAEYMARMQTILKSWIPKAINVPECKAGQDSRVEG